MLVLQGEIAKTSQRGCMGKGGGGGQRKSKKKGPAEAEPHLFFARFSSEKLSCRQGFFLRRLLFQLSQAGQALLGDAVASALAFYEPLLPEAL